MYNSQPNNKEGFSIVLAIGLSLIFTLIALFVMEYIVPFSRSTSGIENATIAQYQSFWAIEQSLRTISQNEPWFGASSELLSWQPQGSRFQITGSWNLIPTVWTWNWLDPNWNRISQTEPIQLLVWENRISSLELRLRVPDFWGTWTLWPTWMPLVLWQLSSENQTLSASGWLILTNNIPFNGNIWGREWILISDNTSSTFWNFYTWLNNCNDVWRECVLRISLINKILQWSTELPFLEYQIETNNSIPFQITQVETRGISFWFSRDYSVRVPQATTSAAFDFTVFQ